jgi:hypothetical protein
LPNNSILFILKAKRKRKVRLQMNTARHNSRGFGAIELLLILVVVAVLAGAGVYVYHREHKTKTTGSTSQNSTVTTTKPDPYAGWKVYTDTQHHYSFKYPADWTLSANATQVTVVNPANNIEVDYFNPYVHDGGTPSFDPVSIADLSVTGLNLNVVGGIYSASNEPDYGVIDSSTLTSNPLTIGKAAPFPAPLHFTDLHTGASDIATFRARASVTMTAQEANAWFSTADAKTSLLIVRSLAYKQ